MSRAIALPGFRVKGGKIVRDQRRLSVSERLRQKGSKRTKPARKGQVR
jgi:hypothetical protein